MPVGRGWIGLKAETHSELGRARPRTMMYHWRARVSVPHWVHPSELYHSTGSRSQEEPASAGGSPADTCCALGLILRHAHQRCHRRDGRAPCVQDHVSTFPRDLGSTKSRLAGASFP